MKKIFSKSIFKFLLVVGIFLLSANLCNAVAGIIVSPSTTTPVIHKGFTANINYTVTGSITSCQVDTLDIKGNSTSYSIPAVASGTFLVSPLVTTTYTVTCEYISTGGGSTCYSYYPTCFIADTFVSMANGLTKKIQDVKIGDVLKGETTNNTVLGLHDPKLEGRKLYSFNGGRYFVTAEHPFKTTSGWKSIDPKKTAEENIGITVTALQVGDTLITENGKVVLKTIDSKNDKASTQLYNFKLDGDHTYYADGYLVHNKLAC